MITLSGRDDRSRATVRSLDGAGTTSSSTVPMNLMHRRLCSSADWATTVAGRMPGDLAGVDLGQPGLRFRLLHIGDTMVVVDPGTLPARLNAAGFDDDPEVALIDGRLRFTARRS